MTTQPKDRAPLLLTIELAEPAQSIFQALRLRHFPEQRNVVPAHVALFHALPGGEQPGIEKLLRALDITAPAILVEPPRSLGRGVAFPLASPELLRLRARLADAWSDWLIPQDRERYRPHVTVQNKVGPELARETLRRLAHGFVPWRTEGTALLLWRYLDGPWEAIGRTALARPAEPDRITPQLQLQSHSALAGCGKMPRGALRSVTSKGQGLCPIKGGAFEIT